MKNISLQDSVDQDQTARSVQSDLDLQCPQKVLMSTNSLPKTEEKKGCKNCVILRTQIQFTNGDISRQNVSSSNQEKKRLSIFYGTIL